MKKVYLMLIVGLCLVALAMAAPDFSGTWVLNAEKSDMGGGRAGGGGGARAGGGGARGGGMGGEMVIKMAGNVLTITQGQNETAYTLDGSEHTASSQRGDVKYTATWSGETLTIQGTRTTQRGESPMKEQYSLSADGKELTIASTRMGQQGETVSKRVYDKK